MEKNGQDKLIGTASVKEVCRETLGPNMRIEQDKEGEREPDQHGCAHKHDADGWAGRQPSRPDAFVLHTNFTVF